MESIKFSIKGRIPSKKNSRNIFNRGGRIINVPSAKHQEWHDNAEWQIPIEAQQGFDKCSIELTIFAPDKRPGDLTNKAESVMDLLVDVGVLADDNWYVCSDLHLKFGGIDKQNPRAEIVIHV